MLKLIKQHPLVSEIVVLGFYSLLFIIFFSPVLFFDRLLMPGDAFIQSASAFYATPTLWSPFLQAGFPVAADTVIQSWYPLARFFAWLFQSANLYVISAYILASYFTYGYIYTITQARFASLVGGLIYGMSGFMMAHLGHTLMVHAVAWIPLLIWALEQLRHRFTIFWFISGTLAITLNILAGHPQIVVYTLGLSSSYVAILGWHAMIGRWRYYSWYSAMVVIGIGLAAIQLIPTVELVNFTSRADMSYAEFISYSIPLEQILGWLFPFLFGGMPASFYYPYFGTWPIAEMSGYVGLLPLMLMGLGFWFYPHRSIAWYWLAISILAFLLTLGDATPLAKLMYHLPAYNKFRVPARHLIEMILAITVLAALGIAAIQHIPKTAIYKISFASLVVMIIALSGVLAITESLSTLAAQHNITQVELAPWYNPALGIPLVLFFITLVVFNYWYHQSTAIARQILIIFLLIIDLGSFGWFCEWRYYSPSQDIITQPTSLQRYKDTLATTHQRLLSPVANLTHLWKVPNAGYYGPYGLARLKQLLTIDSAGYLIGDSWLALHNRSLDIAAIRYVLFLPHQNQPNLVNLDHWHYLEELKLFNTNVRIYENQRAMPRAWLVPEVVTLSPEAIRQTIQTSQLPDGRTYEPHRLALIEKPLHFKVTHPDPAATVTIRTLTNHHLEIETNSHSAAFLVVSDTYYPGWIATIDGTPTPLLQTNFIFRGIPVPAGQHLIHFEFKPTPFYFGLSISVLFLLLLISMTFYFYRHDTKKKGREGGTH